jgi:protein-S-isoprenylcysteine O-methyltransferase Ste14
MLAVGSEMTLGHGPVSVDGSYARAVFGLVARVKAVKKRTRSLVQLNLELAKLEGKQKATAVGIAGGLVAVAGLLLVYAIGFAFAAIAAGLNETFSLWLSLLIVAGILVLVAAIAGFLAVRFVRKASPPKPAQALEEADRTLETLKGHA